MVEIIRLFILLLQKNFLVRKKHWIQSISQVIIPILLILLGESMRFESGFSEPTYMPNNTYHDIVNKAEILENVKQFQTEIKFTPRNHVTAVLIKELRKCLGLEKQCK